MKAGGRQAIPFYEPDENSGQIHIVDIHPGDIDRDTDAGIPVPIPLLHEGADAFPDILVQPCYETVAFENGNKFRRRLQPPFRMVPAHQSLCPGKPSVPDLVLGLQIDLKLSRG